MRGKKARGPRTLVGQGMPRTFSYSMSRDAYKSLAAGNKKQGIPPLKNEADVLEYINKMFGLARKVTSIQFTGRS